MQMFLYLLGACQPMQQQPMHKHLTLRTAQMAQWQPRAVCLSSQNSKLRTAEAPPSSQFSRQHLFSPACILLTLPDDPQHRQQLPLALPASRMGCRGPAEPPLLPPAAIKPPSPQLEKMDGVYWDRFSCTPNVKQNTNRYRLPHLMVLFLLSSRPHC